MYVCCLMMRQSEFQSAELSKTAVRYKSSKRVLDAKWSRGQTLLFLIELRYFFVFKMPSTETHGKTKLKCFVKNSKSYSTDTALNSINNLCLDALASCSHIIDKNSQYNEVSPSLHYPVNHRELIQEDKGHRKRNIVFQWAHITSDPIFTGVPPNPIISTSSVL